ASPIWAKIIKNVTKPSNYLDLTRIPSNMVKVEICAATNTLACTECRGHTELFIKGTEPKAKCNKEMIEKLNQSPSLSD
ncbi:hypothetical protein KA001_02730, partial [Patescibacteria group bacterium]|nr:hypothetical protein [Patescibacteria group bacterium]